MSSQHARAEKAAAAPATAHALPSRAAAAEHGISNQALQQQLRSGALRRKLAVGSADDPAETAADRFAAQAASPCACGGTCPSCGGGDAIIRRKSIAGAAAAPPRADLFANRPGRSLQPFLRAHFERRLGMRLDTVRVHDDAAAAATADDIGARAFTAGHDIGFAKDEFRPGTDTGRKLLAHELAHVAQGGAAIRRQPAPGAPGSQQGGPQQGGPQQGPQQGPQPAPDPAPAANAPPILDPSGAVDVRVEAFKSLVKTTAVHRLVANQHNLGEWAALVATTVPSGDIAALALLQSGGSRPYEEMQDIRDPGLRELRAQQAFGHYRACTGCHIENALWGSRAERRADSLLPWMTPNEMRGAAPAPGTVFTPPGSFGAAQPGGYGQPGGYSPLAGSDEARLNQFFPDPEQTRGAMERVQMIVSALGPGGYRVLPDGLVGELETQAPGVLRQHIIDAITQRQADYAELIGKIDDGDLGYEHFGPIISNLLPLADAEVQHEITDEMDTHHFWATVEAVIVGIATLAALLLTIFPPTSVLGVAALGGLEIGLGAYGIAKGPELITVGSAYSLGRGADDVLSPAQQDAGSMMVLSGAVGMLLGPLSIARGIGRLGSLADALPASSALTTTGPAAAARSFQQGDFLVTIADDGSMVITSASHPDLMIMVRGNTATVYQLMEGGALRVVGSVSVPTPPAGTGPAATPLLLGPGEPPLLGPGEPPLLGPGEPPLLGPGGPPVPGGALPMGGAPGAPEGPVLVDIQGGPAVRGDTGAPTFLPSTVAQTPGSRGVLLEPGDYIPGYAGITTTSPSDLTLARILGQRLPRWPNVPPGTIGPQPPPWEWNPSLAFPTTGPVQVLTRAGASGTTPVPQAFFPPVGGQVQGVPRLIPIQIGAQTAQQDVTALQASTHPELYGQVDQMFWRRPFALAAADAATTNAMGQEIGRMLKPGGFIELRLLRGGEEAQAQAIAAQIPGSRVVVVPRGAILSFARDGERPPGLDDEQWAILQNAGPDIRGDYGALGQGMFARLVRIYRGSAPP